MPPPPATDPRRRICPLVALLVLLLPAAAPPGEVAHGAATASDIDDRTHTLQISPEGYLDVFYDGDAAAANKTGVYNVRVRDGYVWVGYGSSAEPNADHKTVAMRISDGAVGAFANDGRFYVPADSADTPDVGWFTTPTENAILYEVPGGMAHVMGDTRRGSPFLYAHVVPGVSADASVEVIGNGGHARAAHSLGTTILHQVENDQGGSNFRVSEDAGATWHDPVSATVTADEVYTRTTMFEHDGAIHVFEEWRPGDTGTETAEKAILRFEPGQPDEFVVLFDDHSDLAPWSHYEVAYEIAGDTYHQWMYPGVENLIEADGQLYVALASGRCGTTPDLSTPLTEIATPDPTTDAYGNPTKDVWYFGYAHRLYALVAEDGAIFLYDAATDAWTLDRIVRLGFTPHRFHFDPTTRVMALASSRPATGYVASFRVF